jgi:hypothetical protein
MIRWCVIDIEKRFARNGDLLSRCIFHGNMEYRHPFQLADRQRLGCDAAAWHTR